MSFSEEKKLLCEEELRDITGGLSRPARRGPINWNSFGRAWIEYAETLAYIPERYQELDAAVRSVSVVDIETIVFSLMLTEPADGPVRKIYNGLQ